MILKEIRFSKYCKFITVSISKLKECMHSLTIDKVPAAVRGEHAVVAADCARVSAIAKDDAVLKF